MTALYQLTADYRAVADKLAELDLDEDTIRDTLESLSGDLEEKAVNVAMAVRNMESDAAAIKEAEAQMAQRRKALEARAERIKAYLLDNMQAAGISKIECPYFRLSVRDNPPSVEVYELGIVPAEYMVQAPPPPPSLDKRAIGDALKAGVDVPGCQLKRGKRLEIKA